MLYCPHPLMGEESQEGSGSFLHKEHGHGAQLGTEQLAEVTEGPRTAAFGLALNSAFLHFPIQALPDTLQIILLRHQTTHLCFPASAAALTEAPHLLFSKFTYLENPSQRPHPKMFA